ncbi:ATP-binding protein [Microbacterium aquimaris]|uniref:ATP-binding protein n=1 Tax=Microbacterium aquimaris TaxID=459816 RepID=A0ABU5N3E4_9MICO|nr:ATP-binding protein [Microbacterium aquimaris]MDZ8160621.1 ATP-binding protein [Microbacterium aquimaris]
MTASEILPVEKVFVPGKDATVTYNPRDSLKLEGSLETYIRRSGDIMTIIGPTKVGKSVLVEKVAQRRVWLEGSWIKSIDDFWARLASALHVPNTRGQSTEQVEVYKWQILSSLGFVQPSIGKDESTSETQSWTQTLSLDQAVSEVLRWQVELGQPCAVVIDDFHFVEPAVRVEVVRALKALVRQAVPAILITLQHYRAVAARGVQDIGGRTKTLKVPPWSDDDLEAIARQGFAALNLFDPLGRIGQRLARESYKSPALMQTLCLHLCDDPANSIAQTQQNLTTLHEPEDWDAFFRGVEDELAMDWLARLVQGPPVRGTPRQQARTPDGRVLDGYQQIMAGLNLAGPKLETTISDLTTSITAILEDGQLPDPRILAKLRKMTEIAATSLEEELPAQSDDDDAEEEIAHRRRELQPVFEFDEESAEPTIYLVDPFLSYALKWHGDQQGVQVDR